MHAMLSIIPWCFLHCLLINDCIGITVSVKDISPKANEIMGKTKPSAFVYYMQEQKRLVPGWKHKSNQELVGLCDKGWTSLSPKEKKRFEDMKEEAKNRDVGGGNQGRERRKGEVRIQGGYDHLGNPFEDIRRRDLRGPGR